MNYAVITDNIVTNIIFLNPSNAHEFQQAVSTDGLPVAIGDTYEAGKFYREGEEVVMPPEPEPCEDELSDALAALELLGVTPEEGETNG